MRLNEYGRIVQQAWNDLPYHSRDVQLDQFVIMPNHVHGIVVLTVGAGISVGAQHAAPLQPLQNMSARPNVMPGSLGAVVRSFKSATTKHINQCRNTPGHPVWQRNYYDHIIRGDRELNTIRQYIVQNPASWTDDPYRC
jgi:REP element-mobilizing transposase RayT